MNNLLETLKQAALLLNGKKFDEAGSIYELILAHHPSQPDALYGRYKLELMKKDMDKADIFFTDAIYSLVVSSKTNQNHKNILKKWYQEYSDIFKKSLFVVLEDTKVTKKNEAIILNLHSKKMYKKIREISSTLDSMSFKTLQVIVDVFIKLNLDLEVKKFAYSLYIFSDEKEDITKLAEYFEKNLLYNEAISSYNFLIAKYNENDYYFALAKIYMKLLNYDAAKHYLEAVFKKDKSFKIAALALCSLYIKEGQYEKLEQTVDELKKNHDDVCGELILAVSQILANECIDMDITTLNHPAKILSLFSITLVHKGIQEANDVLSYLEKAFPYISKKSKVKKDKFLTTKLKDFENVVAFHTIGRGGSFFFHSLIDGHKEVATVPGVYFKGYFGMDVFDTIVNADKKETVEKFMDVYEAVFDAKSPKSVPGNPMDGGVKISEISGLTTLGDNSNVMLQIDKKMYAKVLFEYLDKFQKINGKDFFKLIHLAWENIRYDFEGIKSVSKVDYLKKKKVLFYHIHNPNMLENYKFQKNFKIAKDFIVIRNWLQSMESWVFGSFPSNKKENLEYPVRLNGFIAHYTKMFNKMMTRLFFQRVGTFLSNDVAAVKLEDVKNTPEATMRAVAKWMGIEYDESLLEASFMGLKFHSNKSKLNPNISEFDKSAIKRKVGVLFSHSDAVLLNTVLRPWNETFEYEEGEFKYVSIEEALAMNENIMDWERKLMDFFEIKEEDALKSIKYRKQKLALALNTQEQVYEELKKVKLIKPEGVDE